METSTSPTYKPKLTQATDKIASVYVFALPQPAATYNRICCIWLLISIGVPYTLPKDNENRE